MSKLLVAWHHFKTITTHRILVMQGCFKMGLYWQGLTHDLSKYSPTEFKTGVQYYQGDKSPNAAEREAKGYSESWLHHKGRNRHHYEYWTSRPLRHKGCQDGGKHCKTYEKDRYTTMSPWRYYKRTKEYITIHPETRKLLERLLKMLAVKGEDEVYRYLRYLIRVKKTY